MTIRTSFLTLPRELRQQILLDTMPKCSHPLQGSRMIDRYKTSLRNVAEPGRGIVLADVDWLERKWAKARYEYMH